MEQVVSGLRALAEKLDVSMVNPVGAFIMALFYWVICPDAAYVPAFVAVWAAVGLDIVTRLYANSKKAGGFRSALRARKITSQSFWAGTSTKIFAYLVIQVFAGLSFRVVPLEQLTIFAATIIYAFLFFREFISAMEHLQEAGATGLEPLIGWAKRKEQQITEGELQPTGQSSPSGGMKDNEPPI